MAHLLNNCRYHAGLDARGSGREDTTLQSLLRFREHREPSLQCGNRDVLRTGLEFRQSKLPARSHHVLPTRISDEDEHAFI